jgi:hypothetical protein
MFKNSGSDSDTDAGHTRSRRAFREVHLENLFMHNYRNEGFYSGEEENLIDEEHSKPIGIEEGKAEEPHREETKTSGTTQTIEVSTIILPIDSVELSNQINPRHQSIQSSFTISPPHTQSGTLGRSMADEMRLPIFRGGGSEDPDHH